MRGRDSDSGRERRNEGDGGIVGKGERGSVGEREREGYTKREREGEWRGIWREREGVRV